MPCKLVCSCLSYPHGQQRLVKKGLLVPVSSDKVDGAVNPFQLYTFDFRMRNAQKNNKNGH